MGFRKGAYATVWEVRNGNGNYSIARISISRKNRETDEYRTEFSGWVRLIGDAHAKARGLEERSRIRIGECDVTNHYDKEKEVTYTNYAIFGFEDPNRDSGQGTQAGAGFGVTTDANGFMELEEGLEDLPFA